METGETVARIIANRGSLLAELRSRQAVVRDFVRAVALQYSTGLYLFGRPGTAKTRTVREVLELEIREPYSYVRGHLTPLGLFELLRDAADEVVVLDDVGSVLRSEVALQILLAALEHPTSADRGRVVKYRRQGKEERAVFRGGIVCISNRELHDGELLAAFKSRVHVVHYAPSDAQLGALMLDIAARGWPVGGAVPSVTAADAEAVARHMMDELLGLGLRFDLRLLADKALPSFQQWKDGEAESDWRDLVSASVREELVAAKPADIRPSRADAKQAEQLLVREIVKRHAAWADWVEAWVKQTGKSERAFYRRLAEIQ